MKHNPTTVQMVFDASDEPVRFFYSKGGKFAMYDCTPSKEEGVGEFLREALRREQPSGTTEVSADFSRHEN
jgi:hypothetical protein